MPNKLYYDDPLAAAIMARDFGVKVHGITSKREYPISDNWEEVVNFRCGKMYIHPDSYDIFQPKEGDVLQSKKGRMGGVSVGFLFKKEHLTAKNKWWIEPRYGDGYAVEEEWATPSDWMRIIQRDYKPFFTPMKGNDDDE